MESDERKAQEETHMFRKKPITCMLSLICALSIGVFAGCAQLMTLLGLGGDVAAPTFSPKAGTYATDQNIAISDNTGGSTIYFTTDESTPSSSSTAYSGPIIVAGSGTAMTIKAYAVKSGMTDSAVVAASYTIKYAQSPAVATPTFDPPAGTYPSDQSVAMYCATSGATIHCTSYVPAASAPPLPWPAYAGPISVAGNGTCLTIAAYAAKSGMTDSATAVATYSIEYPVTPQVETPTLYPPAGTYDADQIVTISCATSGATIHARTWTNAEGYLAPPWPVYGGPISVGGNGTSLNISAYAVKAGMTDSPVTNNGYTIDSGWDSYPVAYPSFPDRVALDAMGRIYISDCLGRVIRIDNISGAGYTSIQVSSVGLGGLAVDAIGRIYIAEPQNCRIIRLDDIGGSNPVYFGTAGSDVGQFNSPGDVFIDNAGRIYVADGGNNRIVRIDDMNGNGWVSFGSFGHGQGQFVGPSGIAVDGSGRIYVAEWNGNRIDRIDNMSGAGWTTFGTIGSGVGQFSVLEDIAVDSAGRIYVTDLPNNNRVVRVDNIGGSGWVAHSMVDPGGIAVDAEGNTYVTQADSSPYVSAVVRFRPSLYQ